jgi:hypothetical protein
MELGAAKLAFNANLLNDGSSVLLSFQILSDVDFR